MFRKKFKDFYIVYPEYLELGLLFLEKDTGLSRKEIFEKLGVKQLEDRYEHRKT